MTGIYKITNKITGDFYIGKAANLKKQRVMIVETGEEFDSIGELERHLGACTGTVAAYRSGKIKTVKGVHVEKCRD